MDKYSPPLYSLSSTRAPDALPRGYSLYNMMPRSMTCCMFSWGWIALCISLLTLVPLSVILCSLLEPDWEVWGHLYNYALPELLLNTTCLLLGVCAGVLLLGVPLAWLTAVHDFPGRHFFHWALMLPLAMPAYVLAFAQLGLLDFTGPLQTYLRAKFGQSSWVPNIRSTPGVILVMSMAFYPYVYLLARNAFSTMGRRALEVSQSLGLSRWRGFIRVALPMARPWISGGLMLALMETLADFGTAAIFNFDTFPSAIYKAWFSLFSLPAAKQLASLLILIVFLLLWFEQHSRGRRTYAQAGKASTQPLMRQNRLTGLLSALLCTLVLTFSFAMPFGQLVLWALTHLSEDMDSEFLFHVVNSLLLSSLAAVLVTLVALLLSYAKRHSPTGWTTLFSRIATLGYTVPGTVLAVGVFLPVAWLDNLLIDWLRPWLPEYSSSLIKGTLLVLMLAYAARFLAVGHAPVDAAMQRISRSQEETARNMGYSGLRLLARLHLPLLRGSLFTGVLMVFVDVMKEMPITLMIRPYGWDTLAVRIFNLTTEGEWERAALPAVAIVLAGMLPVWVLSRQDEGS